MIGSRSNRPLRLTGGPGVWDFLNSEFNERIRTMAWTTPVIEEMTCGMEVNMYFPAEDEGDLF